MSPLERFLLHSSGITVETGLRYTLFAGIAWLLAYVCFGRRWAHRKIIPHAPKRADIRRELLHSAITLVVFGMVGSATYLAIRAGWTQMYLKLHQHSGVWFFTSIVLTIFLHDAYFYWTHRAMHHPRLFRLFHRTHHLSTNPTPWASYSFSPLEAVVQAGIFPLAVFLIPIHPLAFLLFMIWQLSFNVLGHTGFEIHPRWLMDTPLGKFVNTPTNHVMHHEHFKGNYGLYFNFWDRLMGTNHERYEARFREVTSRVREERRGTAEAPAAGESLDRRTA